MIGEDKLPGFIMALAGVDTGLTVVLFTGQPNRWAPRQTKSLNDSKFFRKLSKDCLHDSYCDDNSVGRTYRIRFIIWSIIDHHSSYNKLTSEHNS